MGWTAEGTDGIGGLGNGEAEAAAAVAVGLSLLFLHLCRVSPSSPFWFVVHPAALARAAEITGTRAFRPRRGGERKKKEEKTRIFRNAVTSLMCCQCHVLREFFNAFSLVGRKEQKKK